MTKRAFIWLSLVFLLVSCREGPALPSLVAAVPSPQHRQIQKPETLEPLPATLTPEITVEPVFTVSVAAGVPAEVAGSVRLLADQNPDQFSWLEDGAGSDIQIMAGPGASLADWLYVVAAPFATTTDGLAMADVLAGWQQGESALGRLFISPESAAAWSVPWGAPAETVTIVQGAELVDVLWANRPSWTITPFHLITPRVKVLEIDGLSPLSPDLDLTTYPLFLQTSITGETAGVERFRRIWQGPFTNYDPARLTRVAMTGVTALGRATAYQMEIRGITTPGLEVGLVLRAADIAHISHEAPFAPDCPYPSPVGDPIFCARDDYLALLEFIGTDVVELTGNHVNDWGPENLAHSIDLYEAAGMKIFGGGRDLLESRQPALFEHNGNRIAFVGCNAVGPATAWATNTSPGSRPCDYAIFLDQIARLQSEGYLVIATLQHDELYGYGASAGQQRDFRMVAEAGAAAVSGSQGHHAQAFDLHQGTFIHYGLGNLFFDQMQMLGTRQSFVDVYTVYEGRLLSVELQTSLIENYCCPRPMTTAERTQLLEAVFRASGW